MDDTPDQLNDNLAQQIQLKSELYHDEMLLSRLQQQDAPESATLEERLAALQADYDTKKAEAASLHQMLKQDTTLNHEEREVLQQQLYQIDWHLEQLTTELDQCLYEKKHYPTPPSLATLTAIMKQKRHQLTHLKKAHRRALPWRSRLRLGWYAWKERFRR